MWTFVIGKHDVGDLDHHHHRGISPFKNRAGSSRSRDRAAGSVNSRYSSSMHGGNGGGSVASRYEGSVGSRV